MTAATKALIEAKPENPGRLTLLGHSGETDLHLQLAPMKPQGSCSDSRMSSAPAASRSNYRTPTRRRQRRSPPTLRSANSALDRPTRHSTKRSTVALRRGTRRRNPIRFDRSSRPALVRACLADECGASRYACCRSSPSTCNSMRPAPPTFKSPPTARVTWRARWDSNPRTSA